MTGVGADEWDFGELIKLHKLFYDTYIAEFEHCLVIVKVDKDGNIVKLSKYGRAKS